MSKTIHCGAMALAAFFVAAPALAATDHPAQIDTSLPHDQIYPVDAQKNGEQGDIYLKAYVHTNGRADRVTVEKSSGYPDLDNAAIESVLNWRFVPASQGGEATSDWTTLHLVYQLPSQQAPSK